MATPKNSTAVRKAKQSKIHLYENSPPFPPHFFSFLGLLMNIEHSKCQMRIFQGLSQVGSTITGQPYPLLDLKSTVSALEVQILKCSTKKDQSRRPGSRGITLLVSYCTTLLPSVPKDSFETCLCLV